MLHPSLAQANSCFKGSYKAARQLFINTQERLPEALIQHRQSYLHSLSGPDNEELSCDTLLLSQTANPERLLVLVSGTHGVEGFCGSAIQTASLAPLVQHIEADTSLGVFVIHALNPWGFAWLRRYDHQGIDLNRNFINFDQPLPDNPHYARWHHALLKNRLDEHGLRQHYARENYATFIEQITRGQFQFEGGLFYGGSAPSWSRTTLENICNDSVFSAAKGIAVIDLHTGLGPYGYGELINDHPLNSPGFKLAQQWYGNNAASTELGESVSPKKEGLTDYHWHELMQERGCFVTLEFGTYSIEQLLVRLINEHHYHNQLGTQVRDIYRDEVQQLKQFFYPEELSWQQQVLFRGQQICAMAINGLRNVS